MMDRDLAVPEMTAIPPSGNLPVRQPRRRRRPALSCNECRRRKVKCDQKQPCTQCIKSKTAVCKYDPDATPKGRESQHSSTTPNSTTSKILPRRIVDEAAPRDTSNSLSATRVVLNTLYPTISLQGSTSSQQGFNNPAQQESSAETQTVQELNDRIRHLETMVTSLVNPEQGKTSTEQLHDTPNTTLHKVKGSTHKSRFFTNSHWMNTMKGFSQLLAMKKTRKKDQSSELNDALKKCKDLARAIKRQRATNTYSPPDFRSEMPVRETADMLVQLYFKTFECTYRILHRQSFFREYDEYWNDPMTATDSFIIKLLLVMSIGVICTQEDNLRMRSVGIQWINTAQTWLNTPLDKSRLNLASVEVQCLLILARQTHSIGGDLLWIAVGSLIRTAMTIGLHRDPSNFPKIPFDQAELRRRIWTTILELSVQASLDSGMPPMLTLLDFDCLPPSNYNDSDLLIPPNSSNTPPLPRDSSEYTETSVQITLSSSFETRLKIFKAINDPTTPPYTEILSLSNTLTTTLTKTHSTIYTHLPPTHLNTLDILVRRFLLALHLPFATLSKSNPQYYFSRKTALDTALQILSYPSTPEWETQVLISGGVFREAFSRSASTVCLELISQIEEDSTSSFPSASVGMLMDGNAMGQARIGRVGLHGVVGKIVGISRRRLECGETNVKGFLFWCMVQAQTEAMEGGGDVEEAIEKRAKSAAEEAYEILRGLVAVTPTSQSLMGTPAELSVDWDALMQDSAMDFDIANTWLLDSWEAV